MTNSIARSYGRGSFYYKADTLKNTLTGYKYTDNDSIILFKFKYSLIDKDNIGLLGRTMTDSLY